MPDDNDTMGWEESQEGRGVDPLGILGWDVGGKYKVRSYLGGGGFGEVYEGYNLNLPEQQLVFKFFKKVQSRNKFAKEARILCMLDHPNISRVIDFLPEEGALVVAFIDGRDGGEILKDTGAISEELFLKVARAITNAIAYAHEKKIAHRDIKPANIMFDKSDNIYVIDFGIAKEIGGDATKTSYQALTPLFAAPERQTGDASYNPFLSDIYEMGVTLFNLATNNLPYRNPANPNPAEWGGEATKVFSPQLATILKKATHPDPAKRFQSASEMSHELELLKSAYGGGGGKKRSYVPYIALVALIIGGVIERDRFAGWYHQIFSSGSKVQSQELRRPPTDSPVDTTVTIGQGGVIDDSSRIAFDSSTIALATLDSTADSLSIGGADSTISTAKTLATTDTTAAAVVKQADKPDKKPPKPKPTRTKMSLTISPGGEAMVMIDDTEGSPDSAFTVKTGWHKIEVIHPDFPILKKMIKISGSRKNIPIDLNETYTGIDTVNLAISLVPPSSDHMLDLAFNNKSQILSSFPTFDIFRLKGRWKIEANLIDVSGKGGSPVIDSMVVFPYSGQGIREAVKKSSGYIKLGTDDGKNMEQVPLLIYWSQEE